MRALEVGTTGLKQGTSCSQLMEWRPPTRLCRRVPASLRHLAGSAAGAAVLILHLDWRKNSTPTAPRVRQMTVSLAPSGPQAVAAQPGQLSQGSPAAELS